MNLLSLVRDSISIMDNTHGYDQPLFGKLEYVETQLNSPVGPDYENHATNLLKEVIDYCENVHADESQVYVDLMKYLYNETV